MNCSREGKFISRTTPCGKVVRIPVGVICGTHQGPQITIYGGVHGTEYAGIEAVQRLYRELDPAEVNGKIVISLATNEESILNWIQFAKKTVEIDDMMKELAQGSQYLIDCHGGEFSEGMYPYVICRQFGQEDLDKKALDMAKAFGVPYISFSQYRGEPPPSPLGGERPPWWLWPNKTIADELQIPEITPEIGQRGSRDEQGLMYNGLINVLKQVKILTGLPKPADCKPKIIGKRYWITAIEQGIFFPKVDVGQDVTRGQILGIVRDYFGKTIQEIVAPVDAKVMNINWGMPVKKGGFLLWLGTFQSD